MATRVSAQSGVAVHDFSRALDSKREPLADRFAAVLRQYQQTYGTKPRVYWSPSAEQIRNPIIRSFAELLPEALADNPKGGRTKRVDLDAFGALKDWILVLNVVNGGEDFRYRRFGPGVAKGFGTDLTGSLTSDLSGPVAGFYLTLYRSVMERQENALTIHEPPPSVFVRQWWKLTVPIVDPVTGDVAWILAIEHPQNEFSTAFEALPNPVIVADAERKVRFANEAGRRLFRNAAVPYRDVSIEAFCGMRFETANSPMKMVERRDSVSFQNMIPDSSGRQQIYTAKLSGILQGDRAYYLLVFERLR